MSDLDQALADLDRALNAEPVAKKKGGVVKTIIRDENNRIAKIIERPLDPEDPQ